MPKGTRLSVERMDLYRSAGDHDRVFQADRWRKEIPAIKFPSDWEVKIIPGFGGAIVRFLVNVGDRGVSVYLDGYDLLGAVNAPYWEVYPCYDGYSWDTARCLMHKVDELINIITQSLEDQKSK